jgi:chromosome segregation ATPase
MEQQGQGQGQEQEQQDQDSKVVEFITKASNKAKNIGHNKYQLTIIDLTSEIDSQKETITNQNEEIQMYKNNVTSVQMQLQEKNLQMNDLDVKMKDALSLIEEYKTKLSLYTSESGSNLERLQNENDNLHSSNSKLMTIIANANNKNDIECSKYTELLNRHQTSLSILEKKNKENEELNEQLRKFSQEQSLYKSENVKLQDEIKSIRTQVSNYKNENSLLRTQIFEKEFLLKEWEQNEVRVQETKPSQETQGMQETETQKLQEVVSNQLKVKRGLSKR